jgi:L-histidine N-alpha-methyltransferase
VGVDISVDFLQEAVLRLRADMPGLDARAVGGDMTQGVVLPDDIPRAGRLVFYPGSSIGNFDPTQALELLRHMRALVDGDGGLLIGIDLPKDVAVLEAAYDDAAGVTAAFNRNVLTHLNRLIGSDFVEDQWGHRAFFNQQASRIEMHLEALAPICVRWPGGERRFAMGERIHTENSYKYPLAVFTDMLAQAGFPMRRHGPTSGAGLPWCTPAPEPSAEALPGHEFVDFPLHRSAPPHHRAGAAPVARRLHRTVHARRQPGQMASGPHHLVF